MLTCAAKILRDCSLQDHRAAVHISRQQVAGEHAAAVARKSGTDASMALATVVAAAAATVAVGIAVVGAQCAPASFAQVPMSTDIVVDSTLQTVPMSACEEKSSIFKRP